VETLVNVLSHGLVILFIIGAIGCMLVIPLTAVELFKALFTRDEEEADGTSAPRAVS
jgi:hypothetical protein